MPATFAILGNAVVDALSHVDDAVLAQFKLKKGDSNILPAAQMFTLSAAVPMESFRSGGSAANTAYTLSRLGHRVSFLGKTGTEPAGRHFFEDMVQAGITLTPPSITTRTTEIFILITEDGARTIVQPQPQPTDADDAWVNETFIEQADWLVLEGYASIQHAGGARFASMHAAQYGKNIALQLPSPNVVTKGAFELLHHVDTGINLLIANHHEFAALYEAANTAQRKKLDETPRVITHSGEGASFHDGRGNRVDVATQAIPRPTDSTGAGDAFAAGFLAVYANGGEPAEAMRRGHQLGRAVIQQFGPRLDNPQQVWDKD